MLTGVQRSTENPILCVVSAGTQVIESRTPKGLDDKKTLSKNKKPCNGVTERLVKSLAWSHFAAITFGLRVAPSLWEDG